MANPAFENCGTCGFNKANKIIDSCIRSSGAAMCTIRNVTMSDPFHNLCRNWFSLAESLLHEVKRNRDPIGPVLASGFMEEAACSLPWHGAKEPQPVSSGRCFVCASEFKNGIEVSDDTETRQFCCCRHYIRWWEKLHPDVLLPRGYDFGFYGR